MRLLHGTTRKRAESILRDGPDPNFQETGGVPTSDGVSFCLAAGPFLFGTPQMYARGKAAEFPDEGGPVILIVEVPDEIVARAATEWFPLSQGLVQFDPGAGLEELRGAWAELPKHLQDLADE